MAPEESGTLASVDASLEESAAVALRFGTDPESGLGVAEVRRRQERFGPNELVEAPPEPTWVKVLRQFRDPLIYLLFVAIAVSVAAWALEGAHGWPYDALVIAAIVVANAVLGFVQEARAEHAVQALERMSATMSTVVRDGAQERVPSRDLVPGDLMVLGEGDAVGADARLLAATALQVSEASLTGESEAVRKQVEVLAEPAALGDRQNMVFQGTAVAQGVGRAVVTATGMHTEMGQIADLLLTTEEEPSPLQVEIGHIGRTLGLAVLVIAAVVTATVLLTAGVHTAQQAVTALLLGVSLAVAAVPEGLPTIISVVLALGVQRMAARNAIVKRLSSVETLGSASVICSDKTGTLTRGEMTLGRVVTALGGLTVTGAGYRPEGAVEYAGPGPEPPGLREQATELVGYGCLAGNATWGEVDGEWEIQGDPTEAAFLVARAKLGNGSAGADRYRRVGEVPFTSERKMMSVLVADAERGGRVSVVSKGAPDVLLDHCAWVQSGPDVVALDQAGRRRVLHEVEQLSADAFRTLGVAYRHLDGDQSPEPGVEVEHDLVLSGVVGIIDPPRPEAALAVADASRAGVRVLMITGDHPLTASRIARDLGVVDPAGRALRGTDLDELDDVGLREAVRRHSVYARVTPRHKQRIVDALQAEGHIVAMTGDGVNDAPALKSADIGVAMGRSGTEVSREAARMILADDNFATIVAAVREGRGIFSNIKKFLRYLLSSNVGEVLTVFLGVVLAGVVGLTAPAGGLAVPLLATQILWINLLTDSAPALAMGVDPESEDVMARPPRSRSDRVVDLTMWRGVVEVGLVMAAATLLTLDLMLPGGLVEGDSNLLHARTAAFTVLVLAQLFNALNARSETVSAFHGLFANRWLWAALGLSLLLQVAVVHLPFLNRAFTTTPLTVQEWLLCAGMASTVLWFVELRKLVLRRAGASRLGAGIPGEGSLTSDRGDTAPTPVQDPVQGQPG
ncbi:MAG TPA: cation-translocating P-type ATPase [Nocardioides sp.]|uniref:cation-translocating P-type ATPase n=1 Tax=Nocardioides sp. TaxID=35761 RepID=UPI002C887695|nr:cation-translocating P-type ATPase [Nocardioides sp.]HQR28558.1 cation-translocating P-type ATPase [Nocardioides sp.]